MEARGGNDELVAKVLDAKGPRDRAAQLVANTKLFDVAARKKLAQAKVTGIQQSTDPLIQLARIMEPEYRRLRLKTEELDEVERQAYAKITEVKFALEGESAYPDATFTLRLAFGLVKGYDEDGTTVAPQTTMGGAFEHESVHGKKDPWLLPQSWHQAKGRLDSNTPFNFVCTADIIGGNSGSPIVDRDGSLVGIIFDGNIQSLTADFYHSEHQSRAVGVHVAALLESLKKIYGAASLEAQIGK